MLPHLRGICADTQVGRRMGVEEDETNGWLDGKRVYANRGSNGYVDGGAGAGVESVTEKSEDVVT